jgi:hydroxymethylpyrimidine pyrophosphatase-like HAD family hydrolase
MRFAFIDVDGTMVDKDDNVRPHVPELIKGLVELGFSINVWSAGGALYAADKWNMICNKIFRATGEYLHEEVESFAWKLNWESEALMGEHFYIDDQESILEIVKQRGHKVYHVPFYEMTTDKSDSHLLFALQYIQKELTA